jgi:hypothetical protein
MWIIDWVIECAEQQNAKPQLNKGYQQLFPAWLAVAE